MGLYSTCALSLRQASASAEQGDQRLQHQLDRLRSVLTLCLALVDELQEATIEKVLGKSDIELAMDVLSGKLKR